MVWVLIIIGMSQFDIFTITTKLSQVSQKQTNLQTSLKKIQQNSQKIQQKSLQRVNKVSLFNVILPHTSEYLIKLNNQYIVKVKTATAEEIVQGRIKHVQEEIGKWRQMRDRLEKVKVDREREREEVERKRNEGEKNFGGDIFGNTMEVIGENEEGEQIFNIVEYSESQNQQPAYKKPRVPEKLPTIIQKNQQEPMPTQPQIKQDSVQAPQKLTQMQQKPEQKPKKISKFKAERMQNKQK